MSFNSAKRGRGPRGKAAGGGNARAVAVVASLLVICAAVGIFAGKGLYEKYQHRQQVAAAVNTDRFYSGIRVEGVDLGGMTMQQALEAVQAKEKSAAPEYGIRITYDSKSWEITQNDMTFTSDAQKVLNEAYAYARSGDTEQRYAQVQALKTNPKDYTLTLAPDEDALKAKVTAIAAQVARKPVNPTVVSFDKNTKSFVCKDGVPGLSPDTEKLWNDVKAIAEGSRSGTAEMSVSTVAFDTTLAEVKSHLQKLGTFSTVSTNTKNGTYNMMKALLAVNGTCVPAGGTFSFLGTVGPCDAAHGYLPAGAILNGRLIQDDGGGICQSSTTLYGAALRSNMKITQRSNHTMPSSYCPIGQDATVSYPSLDLKFQNTSAYPVYILTQTKGKTLTATFYGYQPSDYDEIRITSKITQTIPAPAQAKYTLDSSLAAGAVKLDSKARTGYRASAQRVYYKNGSVVRTENIPSSYYKPLPAYYSYGKGADLTKLGVTSSSSRPSSASSTPAASSKKPASSASSSPASSSAPSSSGPESDLPNDDIAA